MVEVLFFFLELLALLPPTKKTTKLYVSVVNLGAYLKNILSVSKTCAFAYVCVLSVTNYLFIFCSPNKDPQDPPSKHFYLHIWIIENTRRPRIPSCGGCCPNNDAMPSGRGGVHPLVLSCTHTLSCHVPTGWSWKNTVYRGWWHPS